MSPVRLIAPLSLRGKCRCMPMWFLPWLVGATLYGCETADQRAVSAVEAQESAQAAPEGCKPLRRNSNLMTVSATASGSGQLCLLQDLVQRNVYDGITGRNRGSPGRNGALNVVNAHDLDVNLTGHLISGEPFDDTTGISVGSTSTRITLRNGVVRAPGREGIGIGMAPYKDPGQFFSPSPEDAPPMRQSRYDPITKTYSHSDPWNYEPATYYGIDQVRIKAGGRGVILAGSGNVLRNSMIEVDSSTAVCVYGPNAVIEGNTFIVHRRDHRLLEADGTKAALKLLDAKNAIVRNNRFVVHGSYLGRADAAINLISSSGVTLENNVVEGAKQLVRKDAASTIVESGTTVR